MKTKAEEVKINAFRLAEAEAQLNSDKLSHAWWRLYFVGDPESGCDATDIQKELANLPDELTAVLIRLFAAKLWQMSLSNTSAARC